jgi:kynurenine formamidase
MSQSCKCRKDVIDLSQTLEEGIPLAHVLPPIKMSPILSQTKGDPVNCYAMVLSEHTGTHFDVPRHVELSGATLDDYEPTSLCGPIVRIDVVQRPKGLEIDQELIENILYKSGLKIRSGSVVLLNTGHSKLWTMLPQAKHTSRTGPIFLRRQLSFSSKKVPKRWVLMSVGRIKSAATCRFIGFY